MEENWKWLQAFGEESGDGVEAAPAEETVLPEASPAEAPAGRYQALEPVLDALAERFGVAAGDGEALMGALKQNTSGKEVELQDIRQGADRIYSGWIADAERMKQVYPDFDLRREMADPRFCALLRSRVDMQTAFEVVHNREIIPAAMQYAARTVEQQLANAMRSGPDRPAENGIRGSGAVMLGSDVSRMSRKDYAAVCRMVERGERVSFG